MDQELVEKAGPEGVAGPVVLGVASAQQVTLEVLDELSGGAELKEGVLSFN